MFEAISLQFRQTMIILTNVSYALLAPFSGLDLNVNPLMVNYRLV
jgi:hypothetical protein